MSSIEERIAKYLANSLVEEDILLKAKVEFGLSIILINVAKIIIILLLSVPLHCFSICTMTFGIFSLLRIYAWGRHSKSNLMCTFITILSFIVLPKLLFLLNSQLILFVVMCVGTILIWKFAPFYFDDIHKENLQSKRNYKIKSLIIAITVNIVTIICDNYYLYVSCSSAILLIVIAILPVRKDKFYGIRNKKSSH